MLLIKYFLPIIMISIAYGMIYSYIHRIDPSAFEFKDDLIDPFYFSFTTMSSVGYGDYIPHSRLAKLLVMSQQLLTIGEVVSLLNFHHKGCLHK